MGEIGTSLENLETAISGETFEYEQMYPDYIDIAKEEGNMQAVWSFTVANKVEKIHATLFSKAIEAVKSGQVLANQEYYVCNVCGNTIAEQIPDKCPICNASKTRFFKVA